MKKKGFYKYQFPAILWALAIFVQSSISDLSAPPLGISAEDKLAHTFVYLILGYLINRAFYFSNNDRLARNVYVLSILSGLFYAISDEIHQAFVPGRFPDGWDVIADFLGILLAQLIFWRKKF